MTITFNPPSVPLTCKTEIALGADLSADPGTWSWTDITAYTRHASGVKYQLGRGDQWSNTDEQSAELVLDNSDGRFSRYNPSGPYYGQLNRNTPIRCGFDAGEGYTYPVEQFVTEFPSRWDMSRADKTVNIRTAGIRRRLAQGAHAKSDMLRTYTSDAITAPSAYWPLEGTLDSETGGATLTKTVAPSFGGTSPAGSAGALDLSQGGAYSAPTGLGGATIVSGSVVTSWEFEMTVGWGDLPTDSTMMYHVVTLPTPGSVNLDVSIWMVIFSGVCYLQPFGYSDSGGYDPGTYVGPIVEGQSYHLRISQDGSASTFDLDIALDGVEVTGSSIGAGLPYYPPSIYLSGSPPPANLSRPAPAGYPAAYIGSAPPSVCHVAVWNGLRSAGDRTITYESSTGHVGETAVDRMTRVCDQEGIRFTAQAGNSVAMGAQPAATLLDILDDCAKVDLGFLYQSDWGLAYQPTDARANADSGMTLSFDQLGAAPEPAEDDAKYRNQWTVTVGSHIATAVNEQGVASEGLYDDATDANADSSALSAAADQAGWRVNRDSIQVPRWPDLFVNFAAATVRALISDFTALDVGAMITLTDVPDPDPPEDRLVFIEGVEGFFTPLDFTARLVTSPADAYRVGQLASTSGDLDPLVGRAASDGCTLRTAINSGSTTLDVDPNGWWWSTDSDDYDPDLRLRIFPAGTELHGEEVDVSSATDVGGSFVAAGVAATSTNTGPVTPALPAGIAANDTLLAAVFGATGAASTPSGWTLLCDASVDRDSSKRLHLFARTYDGTGGAPSFTFSGPVGATTDLVAQTAAFRGLPLDVSKLLVSFATSKNSSAQDITTPVMRIRHRRRLIIAIGAKHDDWTSVATFAPSGTTFTEIGEPDTTTGDDAGLVWDYAFQTSAVNIPASSFVVTGGASAASWGMIVVLQGGKQTLAVSARGANGTTARSWAVGDRVEVVQPLIVVPA